MIPAVLLLLLAWDAPQCCHCASISIVDSVTAFPFLRNVETPTQVMRWDSGSVIQLLSGCKLLRITRRGVRCIASHAMLINRWEDNFDRVEAPSTSSCLALNTALCVTANGDHVFPVDNVYVRDASVSKCTHGQGRLLVPGAPATGVNITTQSPRRDDTSLCDVLDRNLDIVYDPVNNRIFTKELSDSIGLYSCMSILILVVVVLTAEALADASRSHLLHNIIAWVLLTTTSILVLAGADGRMHPFVTVEDRAFVNISVLYVIASTVYWASSVYDSRLTPPPPPPHETTQALAKTPAASTAAAAPPTTNAPGSEPSWDGSPETQRDGVNAMLGSVHFATCVLYGTPDNTYVSGFFFLFLFRCMQKMHSAHQKPSEWTICANTVLVLDVAYTATIFSFGILPHFTSESDVVLYSAAQYVICDTVASNWAHSAAVLAELLPPTGETAPAAPAAPPQAAPTIAPPPSTLLTSTAPPMYTKPA
ncbi:hypothetical protein T484DRAFT_1755583 [Baffinella frigidus]|nr:hypothetical protein T484DRAFT_1755583 [Cryptophyta sp. CCMP2293]